MTGLLGSADAVIRGRAESTATRLDGRALRELLLILVVCGALYGAAMGSFGGVLGDRSLQMIYAAIKVPLLLMVTFALSLPSFFIFNTLAGLGADFGQALRSLVASQAGLTVVLAALAPFSLVWNLSSSSQQATVLFNAALFGVATVGGQILLRRYYRPLLLRDGRHGQMLRIWGIVYAFVGIQMGWILRPFVGDPNRPVQFFREDTWGNAYVIVFQLIRHLFGF